MPFDPAARELLERHRKAKQEERDWGKKLGAFYRDNPNDCGSPAYIALLEGSIAASKRAEALWEQLKPFHTDD